MYLVYIIRKLWLLAQLHYCSVKIFFHVSFITCSRLVLKKVYVLVAFLRIDYKTLFTISKKENLHQLRDFSKRQPWGNGTLFQLPWTYLYNLFEMLSESLWGLKRRVLNMHFNFLFVVMNDSCQQIFFNVCIANCVCQDCIKYKIWLLGNSNGFYVW